MGNSVSSNFLRPNLPSKRKYSAIGHDVEETEESDNDLFSPKRRKVTSTAKYIYKTLFEDGQGSDIVIVALNRKWNLHKLYLQQSPYFNSMFNGLWVETTQKEIQIIIEDGNISTEALHKVFGSLYHDEIQIQPSEAVSILATATLLQLDDIIQQSIEVMKCSIGVETAVFYQEASDMYGLKEVKSSALDWLHKNVMSTLFNHPCHLQQISCDLMAELVASPHLVIIQTEFSLYLLLKQWVFMKETNSYLPNESLVDASDDYFRSQNTEPVPFLLTVRGIPYQRVFRALRLKNLVIHHVDMEVIERDRIIPPEWFMPIFKVHWYQMLRVDQGQDKGPKPNTVEEDHFLRESVRCGRILQTDSPHSWRWTGYNFGFDIVIIYSRGTFKLKRYPKVPSDAAAVSTIMSRSKRRRLMFRICAYALDKNGRTVCQTQSPIRTVSFEESEEIDVITLQHEYEFPLLMSANFLLVTPLTTTDTIKPVDMEIS